MDETPTPLFPALGLTIIAPYGPAINPKVQGGARRSDKESLMFDDFTAECFRLNVKYRRGMR